MWPLSHNSLDLLHDSARVRRGRYGVIDARGGETPGIRLRWFPKLISYPEVWLQRLQHHWGRQADRCLLYYHQPRQFPQFLAVTAMQTGRGTSLATVRSVLQTLEEIARLKGVDALLCDIGNGRISDRLLAREGWVPHAPSRWHRNFIKRLVKSEAQRESVPWLPSVDCCNLHVPAVTS